MDKQIISDPENQPNQFCPQENCMTVKELKENLRELHTVSMKLVDEISQPTYCEDEARCAVIDLIKKQSQYL